MTTRVVHVVAPSRLHFGMLSFGQAGVRQFGGVGAMIDAPGVRLSIAGADRFSASGPLADRVVEFVEHVRRQEAWVPRELPCCVRVEAAPPAHVGLGSGTQLGMAIAIGLNAFFNGPLRTAGEFARAAGRGRRSAIGVHGALAGGLLVEAGKFSQEPLSPLVCRLELPEPWRFLLLTPRHEQGLSGLAERRAFDSLPGVQVAITARLASELLLEVLPAAVEGDFERFSEGLHRFGRLAGECFATQQGGVFSGARSLALIERLRSWGILGTGQTSWGPTIFALTSDASQAERLVDRLRGDETAAGIDFTIAAPNACGTRATVAAS